MTTVEANVKGFTKELSEPPQLHDEEAALRKEKDEKEITTDEELFGPNDVISDEEKEKPSSTKVEPLEEVLKLEISKVELIKSGEEPPAYYTSKLPRFIRVKKQNEAFEPELFEPDLVPVEESNPETSLALTEALRNTMRWRYSGEVLEGPNPEEKMESNANIVTWEDGSMSLVIDGAFHDLERKLVKPPLPPSAIGDHKRKPFRQDEPELFAIYHPSVGCLECVDKVNGSLNVRLEASMMDLSRRSKLISLSENHQVSLTPKPDVAAKAKRVTQYIVVTKDPEKEREKIEKLEAQKEKQRKLELAKRNRLQRPSGTGTGRGSKRGGRAGDILDEEEDDDLEDAWEAYDNHGNSRANLRTSDGYADDGFVVEDEEDQEALSGDDRPDEEELKRKSKKRKQRSNDSKKNRGQWKVDGRGKKKWRGEAPGRRFMGDDDNGGGGGEGEGEEEDFDDDEEEFDEEQEEEEEEEELEELSQENREPVEEVGGGEEEQIKQESTIESGDTAAAVAAATTTSTSTATTTVRVAKKRLAVLDSDEEEM